MVTRGLHLIFAFFTSTCKPSESPVDFTFKLYSECPCLCLYAHHYLHGPPRSSLPWIPVHNKSRQIFLFTFPFYIYLVKMSIRWWGFTVYNLKISTCKENPASQGHRPHHYLKSTTTWSFTLVLSLLGDHDFTDCFLFKNYLNTGYFLSTRPIQAWSLYQTCLTSPAVSKTIPDPSELTPMVKVQFKSQTSGKFSLTAI